jgi:hypothetical protein
MKYFMSVLTILWVIITGTGLKSFSHDSDTLPLVLKEASGQDTTRYVYLGAEKCAVKCHNGPELGYQYDSWKNSRHSKSYESLSSEKALEYCKKAGITENPRESSTCLKCHVTAAGYDMSSLGPTYRKEDGVTCESCHKGEFIRKTFLPKESDCLKSHNNSVHEVSAFDFNERCLKISHPRPKKQQE